MKWTTESLKRFIDGAQGKSPVDLYLRGCQLVNVFSGRVESVDIAVCDGLIAGWGEYESKETVDVAGMYVCPGFIDGHIHIESTLLSPPQFCAAVVPWGTSSVVADPHEIANVLGIDGIRYVLDATENVPLDVFVNLPSCVPATPLETAGAALRATDLYSLLPHDRILGLAEMMNVPGVVHAAEDVIDKLLLFQEKVMDGHAPGLGGLMLNAYIGTGISSDHECTALREAEEKLSKGMAIMLREGSQSKDLATLLPVVNDSSWPHCLLVSDDRHPDDLLREGHMNAIVNRAMALGLNPVRALTLATLTPARYFRLPRRGAIAPGYYADFSISRTLNPWVPERVFRRGIEVARNGRLLADSSLWTHPYTPPSPMRITRIHPGDLAVPAEPGDLRVIGVRDGTLLTANLLFSPKIENGHVVQDLDRDILKLVIYNRYLPDHPPKVAFVHGIGLKEGAIATTVAHDSHNLLAVGTTDRAIVQVADAVRRAGGGMAIGTGSTSIQILPLPIGGLMSHEPLQGVVRTLEDLKATARALGSPLHNPFMALSFLALPVIPELKLTDLGLIDVSSFSIVSLFQAP